MTKKIKFDNELISAERERESGLPIINGTKIGYLMAYEGDGIDISPRMVYHRGTVQRGLSQTLKTQIDVGALMKNTDKTKYRIRKLTPKECYRLMGFSDEDYEAAAKVSSETHLYKQAGNSIVVNVLMAIFKEML